MSTAKEIKRRIKSIKNTAKITKAMELISTIKMKKTQDLANAKKAYALEIMKVFLKIESSLKDFPFFKAGKWNKTLWVIVTSNKWLCWWYNINVMKKVNSYVKETWEKMDFISVWKKWSQFVARTWNMLIADFSNEFTDNIEPYFTKKISKMICESFLSWEYKKVVIFYNHYVSTITQIAVVREFLPIQREDIIKYFKTIFWENLDVSKITHEKEINYEMEPSFEVIAHEVIPMILNMIFLDILLEAKASEHSSRMIAMKNAKDNANKYAVKLTVKYNKARQANITKEISEIVWGVESMKV